jgi:hypothetical protein
MKCLKEWAGNSGKAKGKEWKRGKAVEHPRLFYFSEEMIALLFI